MINPSGSTLICALCVITRKFCCALVIIGASALCGDSFVAVKAKSPSYALSLPATGSISANPSPIQVCDGSGLGVTTLSWATTGTSAVEVHLDEPSGMLVATGGPSGTVTTGKWVGNATQFFLQDASGGLPLSPASTLASVTVYLAGCSSSGDHWSNNSNHINNTNTGNVGIGTSGPVFKLDVRGGQINSAEGLCINGDCKSAWSEVGGAASSPWANAGSNIAFTTGNVGIGTTTPNRILELVQDVGGISLEAGTGTPNSGVIRFGDNTGWKFHFGRSRNSVGGALNSGTSGVLMTIQDNGNVGIGTTSPGQKLSVVGTVESTSGGFKFPDGTVQTTALSGGVSSAANVSAGQFGANTGGGSYTFPGVLTLNGGSSSNWGALNIGGTASINAAGNIYSYSRICAGNNGGNCDQANGVVIAGSGTNTYGNVYLTGSGNTYFNGGNVGIGTVNPSYKLDVAGVISSSTGGFRFPDGTVQTTAASGGGSSQWSGTSGNPIYYNGGNVGIGTPSPSNRIHVSAGDSSFALFGPNTTWGGSLAVGSGADFVTPISGRAQVLSSNGNLHLDAGTNQNVYLSWLNASNTIINGQGGNVGIGTTTPGAKLEVVGNINVTGTGNITAAGTIEGSNIKAKYQDVAEWVESSQELPAGTVVVVDHTKSNQVIASSQAYDTRVAGVISERPGIALGEGGDNRVLVATTGRVRLMVDASKGPIQIGDLLVTSDIRGVAMKSEPVNLSGMKIHRPGTLIGKALEPLAKGSGEILVLLSLQ